MPLCRSRNDSRGPGYFLHAGDLPGYPSSHGCVHLPLAFAKDLFETTQSHDTTVVITDSTSHQIETGPIEQLLRIVEGDASATQAASTVLWEPDKSKEESAAIVISGLDKRIEILRGGVLIAGPQTISPSQLLAEIQVPVPI